MIGDNAHQFYVDRFSQNQALAMGVLSQDLMAELKDRLRILLGALNLAERRLAGKTAARTSSRRNLVPLHRRILMFL
jgi:hypothetical protein